MRQWRDTWWGYLHIMGHPYIFPAYRGCHLLVEETDRRGAVLVQEGHRRLHIVAHRGLLLLGCKRQMRQVQEDDRLYPQRLGHIERQQEVYHMSDVTDVLHQCNPEWEDYCTTGGDVCTKGVTLEYRRHPWDTFWFCYRGCDLWKGTYAAVERRYGKDTWLPAESGAHRAPAFITWATHRS